MTNKNGMLENITLGSSTVLPIIDTNLGSLKETTERNFLHGDSITAVGGSMIARTAGGLVVIVGAVATGLARATFASAGLAVLAVAIVAARTGAPGDIAGRSGRGVARSEDRLKLC